jgi:hypothetical protein
MRDQRNIYTLGALTVIFDKPWHIEYQGEKYKIISKPTFDEEGNVTYTVEKYDI